MYEIFSCVKRLFTDEGSKKNLGLFEKFMWVLETLLFFFFGVTNYADYFYYQTMNEE